MRLHAGATGRASTPCLRHDRGAKIEHERNVHSISGLPGSVPSRDVNDSRATNGVAVKEIKFGVRLARL